ncbi:class I SAM-dependent methyltransferase [Treponema succinifaciens]|uniref:class I SAM-dependent methyltransferase n=1 Tax=Treponema succinifaciens TaxID=167 RepID=UPI0023F38901|nr:class I SAM-dependent methyltransferase [Treponema succinifaciens]
MADKIQDAYESSKNIYDGILTQGNFFSRMYIKLFWSGTDDNEIARKVLSYIPDDFSGKLLDVPVGTAVFTQRKWSSLKNAHITCLDYSTDMLEQAKRRLDGQAHINFIQGDVGNLQMDDESFDIVLSMNGFHAFPDKQKAFSETCRVLKSGGDFIACFYIKGKSKKTDWLVKNILAKKGWFTPPFQTEEELKNTLQKMYKEVELHVDGSMAYFHCVK